MEVKFQGQWGSVCQLEWDINDAKVVCRQLGYDVSVTTNIDVIPTLTSGGTILLYNVECSGHENNLAKCSHQPWGQSSCRHAGVQCVNAPSTEGKTSFTNTNHTHNRNIVHYIL